MDLWKKDQPSRSPENISVTMEITDLSEEWVCWQIAEILEVHCMVLHINIIIKINK